MAVALTIGGVARGSQTDFPTVRIEEKANGIATCNLTLVDPGWAIASPLDLELVITDGAPRLFGGYIREVTVDTKGRTRKYICRASDYNDLLDEDVVTTPASRSADESDKSRVEWLMATHGTKGITTGSTVQTCLAQMPLGEDATSRQEFGGKTMREALNYIARLAGANYYVDFNRVLHWYPADTGEGLTAPFNLHDSPNFTSTFPHYDLDYPRRTGEYRNAVYVMGKGVAGWRPDPPPAAATRRAGALRDDGIETMDQLADAGDAFLAEHTEEQSPTFRILQSGLHVGMAVQVTAAVAGLAAAPFMVSSLTTRFHKAGTPVYTVIGGTDPPTLAGVVGGAQTSANLAYIAAQEAAEAVGGEPVADLTVGGANLFPNSSFEQANEAGWTVGANWVFGALTGTAFDHDRVAEGVPVAAVLGNLDSPMVGVTPLEDYWLSAWSFLSSRTSGTVVIEALEYNAALTLLATTTVATLSAVQAAWTRHSIRFGPNTSYDRTQWQATTAFVRLRFRATGSGTLVWDIDAVQMERGSLLSSYAPAPYELLDGQIVGPEIGPGAITETQIADDAISTPKLQAGSVDTNKLAANSVVAGKIAAGVITSAHIATSGLDADTIKTGTLKVGGLAGAIDLIEVYNSSGQQIGYWNEDGLFILDALDPDIWTKYDESGVFLTRDGGATYLTVMDRYGLHADAVEIGIEPGGSNLIPNSGMEIAAFTSPLSKVWTDTAQWATASSTVNLSTGGSILNLTDVTY